MIITRRMLRNKLWDGKRHHRDQRHVGAFAKCPRAFCRDIREQIGAMEGIRSVQGDAR
jgi:hypothetical protein